MAVYFKGMSTVILNYYLFLYESSTEFREVSGFNDSVTALVLIVHKYPAAGITTCLQMIRKM